MRCTRCNAEVPDGNKFCTACGNPIANDGEASAVTICPRCNAKVKEGNKFCTACGSALEEVSDTPSEKETVFSDKTPVKAAKKK